MASVAVERKESTGAVISGEMLKRRQEFYAKEFADNFWREIEFLRDVQAGRAQARDNVVERSVKFISSRWLVGEKYIM